MSNKKIRINELARELEVKPHVLIELLPEFGVAEKKTHSSSIDEDVAIRLKKHLGIEVDDTVIAVAEEPAHVVEPVAENETAPTPSIEPQVGPPV